MKTLIIPLVATLLGACATMQPKSPTVSILVDLDPASVDRTVIVESITADKEGRLYLPDRVSGNILRVDPKSPTPVAVARVDAREIKGKKVNADVGPGIQSAGRSIHCQRSICRSSAHQGSRSKCCKAWNSANVCHGH